MSRWLALVIAISACSTPDASAPVRQPAPPAQPPPPPSTPHTLTIIGTNDLHGQITRLPILAGFIANARAARAADGGAVLLVDAGDMFQGTLESNLAEGADIVKAYNALGYAATAVGNHEFDYGPVGPAATATKPGEDPRGALKARAAEAKFPFLVANIADAKTGARIDYPNMPASTIVEAAGAKIGIVGLSTQSTPTTTMPANFDGLKMMPSAPALIAEAAKLRAAGATVIVAIAHIGSECKSFDNADDDSSCDHDGEVYRVLADLPPGTVDVVVAGHTHAGVAHRIHGVAVIESYAQGRGFGRVDVILDGAGKPTAVKIFQPTLICPLDEHRNPVPVADCHPDRYEGRPVVTDAAVQTIVDGAIARAQEKRAEKLGVTLTAVVTRAYKEESAEGDLFTELMLAAEPTADVAMTNGGGLRADLPAGELNYGAFFEAMPFDNRFALVDVTGAQIRELVRHNLKSGGGFMSWGGIGVVAKCAADHLALDIRLKGRPLDDKKAYKLVTSDFLASGGDAALKRLHLADAAIHGTDVIIRDGMAEVLRSRKGADATIDPAKLLAHRHVSYAGKRPVQCKGDAAEDE